MDKRVLKALRERLGIPRSEMADEHLDKLTRNTVIRAQLNVHFAVEDIKDPLRNQIRSDIGSLRKWGERVWRRFRG